jgi:uncharacterized membrane protein YiaA
VKETNNWPLFLQLSWKVAAFCVIVFGVGCFFTDPLVWGKGVLFGCIFTIIRLRLMDLSVQKAVQKDPGKASGYFTRQYILRYIMSIAVLVVAALEPSISLYGTMLAMFSLKVATYIQGIIEKPAPKDGSVQFEEWIDDEEEDEEWDRWETYNLKARNKKRKFQERNKIYKEQAVDARPVDDGEQLSLFDEDTEEKEVEES